MSASQPTNLSAVRIRGGNPAGRRFVYLHGLSRGAMSCEPLLPAVAEIWALDHAGHGASERLARYRVVDYLPPLLDWMSESIDEPVWLYGHSLGAMLAPMVAAARPKLVAGMILEDPPFSTMGERLASTDWFPYFKCIAQIAGRWMSPEALGEVSYQNLSGATVRLKDTRSPEMLEKMAGFLGMLDPKVFEEVLAGRWLLGYEFPGLEHRTLIFQADKALGGMLREEDIPAGASVEYLSGVGHLAHWSAPERLREALLAFTR